MNGMRRIIWRATAYFLLSACWAASAAGLSFFKIAEWLIDLALIARQRSQA